MSMCQLWNRVLATRYTRSLEAEVGRLRAENRALLNSILGIAGVPPILVSSETIAGELAAQPQVAEAVGKASPPSVSVSPRRKRRPDNALDRAAAANVPPAVRHRSWQQINRILEFDSAKRKEQASGERP